MVIFALLNSYEYGEQTDNIYFVSIIDGKFFWVAVLLCYLLPLSDFLGLMSIDPDSSLRDNLQERKIIIPINLLDCENCESTKQNGDDASLMRFFYLLQIGHL